MPLLLEHFRREVADPRTTLAPERVMGRGPYRLIRYDKTQGAYAYEANPDFLLGLPRVQRIYFVPASLLPRFRNDRRFHLLSDPAF